MYPGELSCRHERGKTLIRCVMFSHANGGTVSGGALDYRFCKKSTGQYKLFSEATFESPIVRGSKSYALQKASCGLQGNRFMLQIGPEVCN